MAQFSPVAAVVTARSSLDVSVALAAFQCLFGRYCVWVGCIIAVGIINDLRERYLWRCIKNKVKHQDYCEQAKR